MIETSVERKGSSQADTRILEQLVHREDDEGSQWIKFYPSVLTDSVEKPGPTRITRGILSP